MIEGLLKESEGKTLEFKENTIGTLGIIKTVIAFANTSGGIIIFGIKDKSKEIVGLKKPLLEEEKLANIISDNISPLLIPEISIKSYRNKELIIIRVPHVAGPFYLKKEGLNNGVHIRFGSTNRKADIDMLTSLKLFASNKTFDETPAIDGKLDETLIKSAFSWVKKFPNKKTYKMLGLYTNNFGRECPTLGGILLFGKNKQELLPDTIIRCVTFQGKTRERILDSIEITSTLPFSIKEGIQFIDKHIKVESRIGKVFRKEIPQYPPFAIREALINAIVHTDYSIKGCHIQIAIFSDRIEFTNPGGLPFGQTLKKALAGYSRLRNRIIGRVFRELQLIEQWGSGLQRILEVCKKLGLKTPLFEEENNHFRVTLFAIKKEDLVVFKPWEKIIVMYLQKNKMIRSQEAAKLWNVSSRTARTRLKKMIDEGIIMRISTAEKDPYAVFILPGRF